MDAGGSAEAQLVRNGRRSEISEYTASIPPTIATLEPFLLRTEAIASSRIEEELTTVDQLARTQHGISAPKTARTVKGAIDGLNVLVTRAAEGVNLDDILAAHPPLIADDPQEKW